MVVRKKIPTLLVFSRDVRHYQAYCRATNRAHHYLTGTEMEQLMYIVSACLAGLKCAYDDKDRLCPAVVRLVESGEAIPVCPEQLGGLPTPRLPVEIYNGRVTDRDGNDYTANFIRGAEETLKLARLCGAKTAILKARSPSCGYREIYDGTFSRTLVSGHGFAAEALLSAGFNILTEKEFSENKGDF